MFYYTQSTVALPIACQNKRQIPQKRGNGRGKIPTFGKKEGENRKEE
jgi:hypothetical protein